MRLRQPLRRFQKISDFGRDQGSRTSCGGTVPDVCSATESGKAHATTRRSDLVDCIAQQSAGSPSTGARSGPGFLRSNRRVLAGIGDVTSRWGRAGQFLLLCFLSLLLGGLDAVRGSERHSNFVEGEIIHISEPLNIVWVQGEYCGSTRMCEGVIYGGVDVLSRSGSVVRLDRLVLLHPETTDCFGGDPYWGMLAVSEAFSPTRTGKILEHAYSSIEVGRFHAVEIDLSSVTDKRMGFAAEGAAFIGRGTITVNFSRPIQEDLHLKSFCNDEISGVGLITSKELVFR